MYQDRLWFRFGYKLCLHREITGATILSCKRDVWKPTWERGQFCVKSNQNLLTVFAQNSSFFTSFFGQNCSCGDFSVCLGIYQAQPNTFVPKLSTTKKRSLGSFCDPVFNCITTIILFVWACAAVVAPPLSVCLSVCLSAWVSVCPSSN